MMKHLIQNLNIIMISLAFRGLGLASEIPSTVIEGPLDDVWLHVELLEDPDHSLTINDVVSEKKTFKDVGPGPLNIEFTKSAFWGKFKLENPTKEDITVFLHMYPFYVDILDLYIPTQTGQFKRESIGDKIPVADQKTPERHPWIELKVSPGVSTYYFRVFSGGEGQPILSVMDKAASAKRTQNDNNIISILIGILSGMLIYNTILWAFFRTKVYGYYVAYMASFLVGTLSSSRYAAVYLYPHSNGGLFGDYGLHLGITGVMIFACLFAIEFLDLKKHLPKIEKTLKGSVVTFAVLLFLMPALGNGNLNVIVFQFVALPLMIYSGFYRALKGYRPAVFYLISWSFFIVGAMVWTIATLNVIPFTFAVSFAPGYGTALECMILALALGDKMRLEQLHARTRIEKLNSKLKEKITEVKDKERARTLFFNNVSHELRTPLNGILGFLDMILRRSSDDLPDTVTDKIKRVKSLANSLKMQVNAILDIARSKRSEHTLQLEKIDLNGVMDDLENLIFGLSQKFGTESISTKVSWDREKEAIFITDKHKLLTILTNLLGNAFKFKHADHPNNIELILELKSDHLYITVKDTGIGIKEELLPKIFDEFEQVEGDSDRSYEGTGLGLAIVKRFVNALDGDVSVESTLGKGSIFKVSLKAKAIGQRQTILTPTKTNKDSSPQKNHDFVEMTEATPESIPNKIDFHVDKKKRSETILVVDDNQVNVEVLVELLLDEGFNVEDALSGKVALEKIKAHPPDLVLLDVMMPQMSGDEVLEQIRKTQEGQALPVVFLTAKASEEDKLSGLKASADGYLAKPVDTEELLTTIENLLERTRKATELGRIRQEIESAKMVGLGTMAAGIAHEINNPLAIISGYASRQEQIFQRLNITDENILKSNRKIIEVTKRISKIVQGLRTFSRDGQKDPYQKSLAKTIISASLELCEESIKTKNIKIQVTEFDDSLYLFCRETQVMQVLINLLQNAADEIQGNPDAWIEISVSEDEGRVSFRVTNSGKRIDAEVVERIFDPFFTMKEVGKGTGLGLSISRGIAEDHGGTLGVNLKHQFTQFVLSLPMRPEKSENLPKSA